MMPPRSCPPSVARSGPGTAIARPPATLPAPESLRRGTVPPGGRRGNRFREISSLWELRLGAALRWGLGIQLGAGLTWLCLPVKGFLAKQAEAPKKQAQNP